MTCLRSCCWPRFFFFSVVALDPPAGVLPAQALASFFPRSFYCQFFFFSFLAFSASASVPCLDRWGPFDGLDCGAAAFVWDFLDCSSDGPLTVSLGYSGRLPWGHLWSRSQLKGHWSWALAFVLFAFLIRWFQLSCSRHSLSIHNFIEGRRPSSNYLPRIPSD